MVCMFPLWNNNNNYNMQVHHPSFTCITSLRWCRNDPHCNRIAVGKYLVFTLYYNIFNTLKSHRPEISTCGQIPVTGMFTNNYKLNTYFRQHSFTNYLNFYTICISVGLRRSSLPPGVNLVCCQILLPRQDFQNATKILTTNHELLLPKKVQWKNMPWESAIISWIAHRSHIFSRLMYDNCAPLLLAL